MDLLFNFYIKTKISNISDIFKFKTYDKMYDNIYNIIYGDKIQINKIEVDKLDTNNEDHNIFKNIINFIKSKNIDNISYFDYFKSNFDYIATLVDVKQLELINPISNYYSNKKSLICDIIEKKLKKLILIYTKDCINFFYNNKESIVKIVNIFSSNDLNLQPSILFYNGDKYKLSDIKKDCTAINNLYSNKNATIENAKDTYNTIINKIKQICKNQLNFTNYNLILIKLNKIIKK